MPELPEVECVRKSLETILVGRVITSATLHRRDVLTTLGPKQSVGAALLAGSRIARVVRHGKHLAIIADTGRVLEIHLGMSGQVLVVEAEGAMPRLHVHAVWRLEDRPKLPAPAANSSAPAPSLMLFRDPRRFGGLWSHPGYNDMMAGRWSRLGPDALMIRAADLAGALHRTRRAIKAALLDQSVLAGVGNIYADEALHLAALHPARVAGTLNPQEIATLASTIRQVLAQAIASGGSTLRDYTSPTGSPGSYQLSKRVYGRHGQPCHTCSTILFQARIAGRTTSFCPHCQPKHTTNKLGPAE